MPKQSFNLLTKEDQSAVIRELTVEILTKIRDNHNICPDDGGSGEPCTCELYDSAMDALLPDRLDIDRTSLLPLFRECEQLSALRAALLKLI